MRGFRGLTMESMGNPVRVRKSGAKGDRKLEADFMLLVKDYLAIRRIKYRRIQTTGIPLPAGNGLFRLRPNPARGMADLVLCWRGRYVAIELKATDGKQTPEQKLYQQEIEDAGGVYLMPCGKLEPLRQFFEGDGK